MDSLHIYASFYVGLVIPHIAVLKFQNLQNEEKWKNQKKVYKDFSRPELEIKEG